MATKYSANATTSSRTVLASFELRCEQDLVVLHQKTRQLTSLLGFEVSEQTRVTAAIFAIARNAVKYAGAGRVSFFVSVEARPCLGVDIHDQGPGIAGLNQLLASGDALTSPPISSSLLAARRLMDGFQVTSARGAGTHVCMLKRLPTSRHLSERQLVLINAQLGSALLDAPPSFLDEMHHQTKELMEALAGDQVATPFSPASGRVELGGSSSGFIPGEPEDADAGSPAGATNPILIIDDNENSRYLLARILKEDSYPLLEASNGRDGLTLAQEHNLSAIFLDLIMPGMSGFEFIEQLRQRQGTPPNQLLQPPVIIYTSRQLSNEERESLLTSCVAIIAKGGRGRVDLRQTIAKALNQTVLRPLVGRLSPRALSLPPTSSNLAPTMVLYCTTHSAASDHVSPQLLERTGYHVVTVYDLQEAVAIASQHAPALVILASCLPAAAARTLIDQLKHGSTTSHIAILQLYTASTTPGGGSLAVFDAQGGADSYLREPVSAAELTAHLQTLVRLQQAEEALKVSQQSAAQARQEAEHLYNSAKFAHQCKDEFLSTLSHELRSPLNILLGYSDLLLNHRCSEEETREALEAINRNAKLQTLLIHDLLDMSRIISGRLSLAIKDVDLAAAVHEAVANLQLAADAKGVRLVVSMPDALPPLLGDFNRLQQALWNLLSNAVKFTPQAGEVRLDVRQQAGQLILEVSDTGCGIGQDFLPYVFDRMRQEDTTLVRRQGGLGLGLTITRQIVELHGGEIGAQSAGKGQGARFTITLPLRANVPQSHEDDAVPSLASSIKLVANQR